MSNPGTVFEVSWEVCNKVGGIYQVVKSKAELLKRRYPRYICIGPYKREQAQYEFQQLATPGEFKAAKFDCRVKSWSKNFRDLRCKAALVAGRLQLGELELAKAPVVPPPVVPPRSLPANTTRW